MGLFDRGLKRTRAVEELARHTGLKFTPKDEYGQAKYFGDLRLFRVGDKLFHVLKGWCAELGHRSIA